MGLCPKDFKPCIDDVCYGAGCMRMGGYPMYTQCNGCGQPVAMDGSDDDFCTCEPDDDYYEDDPFEVASEE